MHRCNGHGDCDTCHNRHCKEWVECDICGEPINEPYISNGEGDFHTDCYIEKYEVNI